MTRANKAFVLMIVATLGLWGCAQEHKKHASSDPRLRALESKNAKLEDDFRAVVTTRDKLRKQLAAVEEEKARLAQQVEQIAGLTKERDELKQQLTSEREQLQAQFAQSLKQIRSKVDTLRNDLDKADSACKGITTQPLTKVTKNGGDGDS
jgi:septal ring factor EnvC (AmiA/AmiB activator)